MMVLIVCCFFPAVVAVAAVAVADGLANLIKTPTPRYLETFNFIVEKASASGACGAL